MAHTKCCQPPGHLSRPNNPKPHHGDPEGFGSPGVPVLIQSEKSQDAEDVYDKGDLPSHSDTPCKGL